MRFIPDGPDIPEELLVARDQGDVIFFCGAGVSQANAGLPNFAQLGRAVIRILGAAQNSPARRLLERALQLEPLAGVGGLVATDRVFGLLEREFEVADVRAAVAEAIRPPSGYALDAHKILLDLATSRTGVTRMVTTNFDLLFEQCRPELPCSGPPRLPDPGSDREFRGIVHIHGRVDADYLKPHDDEFVVSSADFGRAYLTDGWATQFIRALLTRFQIVFVGYTADDPPVQYLLEALNLRAGTRSRLYAFQSGEPGAASALWEHRGVKAISFDSSKGFSPLWDTLFAWAERARNIDGWYADLIAKTASGPAAVTSFVRGQVASVMSTREGAHRFASSNSSLDARWLMVLDAQQRYRTPRRADLRDEVTEVFDPFLSLGLDFDPPPDANDPEDYYKHRSLPDAAWDAFAPTRSDQEEAGEVAAGAVRGALAKASAPLSPRLASLGIWIQRVAHDPIALWWAVQQRALHHDVFSHVEWSLRSHAERFSPDIRRGWRLLFATWADQRGESDSLRYEIAERGQRDGWSLSLVREVSDLYKPRLNIRDSARVSHPLHWKGHGAPDRVFDCEVKFPHPHEPIVIPNEFVAYAVSQFRSNLELSIALSAEVTGSDGLYIETTRANDGQSESGNDRYGLAGPIVRFQQLMDRWALLDPDAAQAEVKRWPAHDLYIFARLRIWAAGRPWVPADQAGEIFNGLPDVVFWGAVHQRDLLYAMCDRWLDLSDDARKALERRLRTTSYPWADDVQGDVESRNAYYRLSRLHWLSKHGAKFGFDIAAEMAALRAIAPDWNSAVGDEVADSNVSEVYSIQTDDSPDSLLEVPIPKILEQAQRAGQLDILSRVQREPFRGLAARKPGRALAALTHAMRQGELPREAWADFLRVESRATDSVRMISAVAGRLACLPKNQLCEIAYPVSEWMERVAGRFYSDAARNLPRLWEALISALNSGPEGRPHRPDRSWADEALNAPVGRLFGMLMKDPAKNGLDIGAGFPPHWKTRAEQLLTLAGNLRRHALVMIAFQANWLYTIDPRWTELNLLSASEIDDDDGDAFWAGFVWPAKLPSRKLLIYLKDGIIRRAVQPSNRRGSNNLLAGCLIFGWGDGADATPSGPVFTDDEFREVLINADDGFRRQVISFLKQWASGDNAQRRELVLPFLRNVWPKQRALRNVTLSSVLAELALSSGELMPEVVKVLDVLGEAPEIASDPQLAELRRRRER